MMLPPSGHVLTLVDDYLHQSLTRREAETVQRHCDDCRICKVALEEAQKRLEALRNVPACEASGELIEKTLRRIDRHETGRRTLKKWYLRTFGVAAAACVLLLGGLYAYYFSLSVTPYDLTILGQNQLLAGTVASLRVRLTNHLTGAALAGVPVEISLRDKSTGQTAALARFMTDAQGTGRPRMQLPDWKDGGYELHVRAQTAGRPEEVRQPVQLKRSWKLMLTSDKPVYQPGQEIHLRGLALRRPDLKPVAGETMAFSISDPKGNVIFKRQEVTSRFGIAAADCLLATEIFEGSYLIDCRLGDTQSRLAVEVKRYVLPKFQVKLDLDEPFYRPGQRARGKVQAAYFFGKPVVNAAVEVEVKTPPPGGNGQRLTLHTDPAGEAPFDVTMPPIPLGGEPNARDVRVSFEATVTDSAGQAQHQSSSRIVTTNPLHVEVIPEGGTLVEGVANTIYFLVTSADGRPVKARVIFSGIGREVTTSDLGVASVLWTPGESAADPSLQWTPNGPAKNWTVRAIDDQGREGRRTGQFACALYPNDFLVQTDRAVYDGGSTVRLTIRGGGSEPVLVDFIKDRQTVLTQTVEVKNGRGEQEFDLPADLFGTVELSAYRFYGPGWLARKNRVLYVRPARQLCVEASLDRKEYRPGRPARLQVALTDRHDKPTTGAVSLAAVDEAVFSVLESAPGMEARTFHLEDELLKPVYALYPWTPEGMTPLPPAEREDLERALFAAAGSGSGATALAGLPPGRNLAERGSLLVDSFPVKAAETAHAKDRTLRSIRAAWILGVVVLCAAGYLALWAYVSDVQLLLGIHAIGLTAVFFIGLAFMDCSMEQGSERKGERLLKEAAAPAMAAKSGGGKVEAALEDTRVLGEGFGRARAVRPGPQPPADALAVPEPSRVRELFPETLLWRPELITDDRGHASLDIDLADSITTWRLSAGAVAADGRLGSTQASIRVFQPFFADLNLPVSLTLGDQVTVPVVVYNYLDKPQKVELKLGTAPWFNLADQPTKTLDLKPNEAASVSFRLQTTRVGSQQLQVTARGSGVADAVKRSVEVLPYGRRVDHTFNGGLDRPAEIDLVVPDNAVEGSAKAYLKLYPSNFSQLVEGLDGIFQQPYGCFEQTSSTTYPNVLALDYLRRTGKDLPAIEARARQFIHLGYQRLLSFEVAGGGFDWFGNPPANRTLTAYGLMEFQDMARVHDMDPGLIERTRRWLLGQRDGDGAWAPTGGMFHDDPTRAGGDGDAARLATSAYIAWAVFGGAEADSGARPTLGYLLRHPADSIPDAHTLSLVCNALLALDPRGGSAGPYLDRLEAMCHSSEDGQLAWWEMALGGYTTFYGAGHAGNVETTALACLALLQSNRHPATTAQALAWLVRQRTSHGAWDSTQATVLALKALLAAADRPSADGQARVVEWTLDGKKGHVIIPADQADVVHPIDLSAQMGRGKHRLALPGQNRGATVYQVTLHYHVPSSKPSSQAEPLAVDLAYDREELEVGGTLGANVRVENRTGRPAPMVILDLPIPAGFVPMTEDLDAWVKAGTAAKYQLTPRALIVYLRGLPSGKALGLHYGLRATLPAEVTAAAPHAYEYYSPDREGFGRPHRLVITPRR